MALLSREEILRKPDRTFQEIYLQEWGGKVRIRSLTGAERDAFEESIMGKRNKDGSREVVTHNLRAKLVALTVVDEDGNLLFSPDDVAVLGEKSAAALDQLFAAAQRLAGISRDDLGEMVKNSEAGPGAGSTSGSPNTSEA